MMALGARIRAYATTSGMAPLAIVASTSGNFERAQLFAALAEARQWLDVQAPSP